MAILLNLVSLNPPVHWFTWKVTLKANGSDFFKECMQNVLSIQVHSIDYIAYRTRFMIQ